MDTCVIIMTELLGKIFIKNRDDIQDKKVRGAWGTLVSIVGIIMNVILFIGKFTVGTMFGALSISADAINNLSDAGSQLISLVSFRLSSKPADRKHPFGHARIEYVASMIVAFLIVHVGFDLLSDAIDKIKNPELTTFSWLSVGVLAASVLVKLWLGVFNKKVGKKINSSVMEATAADSLSDVAATSAVLLSQLVLFFFKIDPDAYLGLCVALLIMWAGLKILIETSNTLIGGTPDEETIKSVVDMVLAHDGALGVHDLWAHSYGPGNTVISLHVEVDGKADIFDSHDLVDNIERQVFGELGVHLTIHMDPIVTGDAIVSHTHDIVSKAVTQIDERIKIHDFRMVRGTTHTNLIFDIDAPYELKMTDEEIAEAADRKLREINGEYRTVITVDRS